MLVSHMPLANSLFHLNKCAKPHLHAVTERKRGGVQVSLTPTLQRQQQRRNAAPLAALALAGTLPKGALAAYRGGVVVVPSDRLAQR